MWIITVCDLQYRRRQFAIAVVGAGLVFAVTLVLTGMSSRFRHEARTTVGAIDADAWILPRGVTGPFTAQTSMRASPAQELEGRGDVLEAHPLVKFSHVARRPDGTTENVSVLAIASAVLATRPGARRPARSAGGRRSWTSASGSSAATGSIEQLDVAASDGELVILLGPSGSDKTTLLSCLAGLLTPAAGTIHDLEVTGLQGSALADYRLHHVGIVFQAFNLIPSLNARENVAAPLRLAGVHRKKAQDRAEELLARVGLEERMYHRPSELSGGQQQRVAIARALVHDPPLIVADEPHRPSRLRAGGGRPRADPDESDRARGRPCAAWPTPAGQRGSRR